MLIPAPESCKELTPDQNKPATIPPNTADPNQTSHIFLKKTDVPHTQTRKHVTQLMSPYPWAYQSRELYWNEPPDANLSDASPR